MFVRVDFYLSRSGGEALFRTLSWDADTADRRQVAVPTCVCAAGRGASRAPWTLTVPAAAAAAARRRPSGGRSACESPAGRASPSGGAAGAGGGRRRDRTRTGTACRPPTAGGAPTAAPLPAPPPPPPTTTTRSPVTDGPRRGDRRNGDGDGNTRPPGTPPDVMRIHWNKRVLSTPPCTTPNCHSRVVCRQQYANDRSANWDKCPACHIAQPLATIAELCALLSSA